MIIITGKKRKKRLNLPGRVKFVYVWPTNLGELTLAGMAAIEKIPANTIYTRIGRYGYDDPRVFSVEHLPKGRVLPNANSGRRARSLDTIKVGTLEEKYL